MSYAGCLTGNRSSAAEAPAGERMRSSSLRRAVQWLGLYPFTNPAQQGRALGGVRWRSIDTTRLLLRLGGRKAGCGLLILSVCARYGRCGGFPSTRREVEHQRYGNRSARWHDEAENPLQGQR